MSRLHRIYTSSQAPHPIKRRLGNLPVNIDHFIIEFKPAGERVDHYLNYQGCASNHRHGWSVIDRSRATQCGRSEVALFVIDRN